MYRKLVHLNCDYTEWHAIITRPNTKNANAQYTTKIHHSKPTMTDAPQVFTHTVVDRDVTMNAIMVDDMPWFRANDIAIAVGYANTRQAIITHVDA